MVTYKGFAAKGGALVRQIMTFLGHTIRLHDLLLYGAYCWLVIGGVLHFVVDVASQYFRGKRMPSPATTLYYGLNSTYAVSQVLFGALALFAIWHDVIAMEQAYGIALGLLAACTWFILCLRFIEYPQPRLVVAVYASLLVGVALTGFPSINN